jgi:hypothetical protein
VNYHYYYYYYYYYDYSLFPASKFQRNKLYKQKNKQTKEACLIPACLPESQQAGRTVVGQFQFNRVHAH